ncbi:MAG: AEC family transporter [Nitratireductor sp.]|nr:AEC family transporter [Nitratireductor sp.]
MSILLNSLLPVFLLILLGAALRTTRFVPEESWPGMERIAYYIFFPALLIQTLYQADFGELAATKVAAGLIAGILSMLVAMIVVRPLLQPVLGIGSASYSSLYQATTRWNAFIILAIAGEIAGARGLTIVAIAIGTMIVPINIFNIPVVAMLGDKHETKVNPLRQIAGNPLIVGVAAGLALNFSGLRLPVPLEVTMGLLGRISLPLGLLLVGAGLKLRLPGQAIVTVAVGTVIKLLVMPAILVLGAWLFGVRGEDLLIVALCGAGPAAMNGFLVARELGGDAPLFAAMVTAQTLAAFVTIPLVILVAGWLG